MGTAQIPAAYSNILVSGWMYVQNVGNDTKKGLGTHVFLLSAGSTLLSQDYLMVWLATSETSGVVCP